MTRLVRSLLVTLALVGCAKKEPAPDAASSAPAHVSSATASAVASASAPAPPWYTGTWVGTYSAERLAMEVPIGGVREWKSDDGKKSAGQGQVKLSVSRDGVISGNADGALGKHVLRGSAVEQELRVEFLPETPEPEAFRGIAVTKMEGDQQSGELKASSGDSLTVRRASLTLRKEPGGG